MPTVSSQEKQSVSTNFLVVVNTLMSPKVSDC